MQHYFRFALKYRWTLFVVLLSTPVLFLLSKQIITTEIAKSKIRKIERMPVDDRRFNLMKVGAATIEAIEKFPDLKACKNKGSNNLDWSKLYWSQELRVCLFYLFETYEAPQQASEFLRANGFGVTESKKQKKSSINPGGYVVNAFWSKKLGGYMFQLRPSLFETKGGSITAKWSSAGELLTISTSSSHW